jgi:hypothetical protein
MLDIIKLSSTYLKFGAICDILGYHRFSKGWFSADYLNVSAPDPKQKYSGYQN